MCNAIIGWVRDSRGVVTHRTFNAICNAVTSMVGGGHADADGLANPMRQGERDNADDARDERDEGVRL